METLSTFFSGLLLAVSGFFGLHTETNLGATTFITQQGGTGTSSPSGILYGDNNATQSLKTVTIGSNLTFTGGTLNASGGSGNVSTSTGETSGNLAYWTSTNATPALLGKVATTSLTINSPLTTSGTAGALVGGSALTIDIDDIKAADLDLTDITLNDFTNDANFIDLTDLSATFPIAYNSGTGAISWIGLATTSSPTAGNIFYSNGTNGLIPIATSSINVGTASALFANGSNCSAGFFPLGVDASGVSETCTYAFATTTPWSTGLLAVSNTGLGYTIASSTLFGYTPLNPTRQITVASGNGKIVSSAGAQDLSADRTWTLTYTGLATTSQPASSNLLVSNGAAGVFGVATTSVSCTDGVSCTGFSAFGAASSITSTLGTSIDISSETNLAATWPVILTGDTLSFGGLSTSTAAVQGNIPYFSGVNTFANVATSSLTIGSGLIQTGTAGALVGGTALTVQARVSTSSVAVVGGIPYWTSAGTPSLLGNAATSTITCSGSVSCGAGSYVIGSALTITGSGGSGSVATSTNETAGNLPYWTSTNGTPATVGKVATTSVTCGGSVTCTGFTAIGASPISITNAGGSLSGWATSTAYGTQLVLYPLNGTEDVAFGGIGTGATTSAPFWWDVSATSTYIGNGGTGSSTMTVGSSGNQWIWGTNTTGKAFEIASSTYLGVNTVISIAKATLLTTFNNAVTIVGNTIVGALTASGIVDFGGATSFELPNNTNPTVDTDGECAIDTTSGQLKCDLSAVKVISDGNLYPSFSYSTSTAWTGTTTIPLGPAFVAETWNAVQCFTNTGTLHVRFEDVTPNRMNLFNASTTVGTVTLSTNNTFTAAEKRFVAVGTPASSPTSISCTVSKSLTAD